MNHIDHTIQALANLVKNLPVGTNSALYQFLWMLLSGKLHSSRGAIFPALLSLGLTPAEVRRSWAGFRYGAWAIATLLLAWRTYVEGQGQWRIETYEGYCAKSVDITAFWRPTLRGLKSKHYDAEAERALPAVTFGLIGRVGRVGDQRLALLTKIVRNNMQEASESNLTSELLDVAGEELAEDEVVVLDAGFELRQLLEKKRSRVLCCA